MSRVIGTEKRIPTPDPLFIRLQGMIAAGRAVLLAERPNVCNLHDLDTGRPLVSRRTGKPCSRAVIERLYALPHPDQLPVFYYACVAAGGLLGDATAPNLEEVLSSHWLPGPVEMLCPKECQARGWIARTMEKARRAPGVMPCRSGRSGRC